MKTDRPRKKRSWKKWLLAAAAIALCAALILGGLSLYGSYQMGKIPGLSFREALAYTTENNEGAVITVGVLQNGTASYTVYGSDGKELPAELHTYEIGSLTKTFTAAMVGKAISEGKLSLESDIGQILSLPEGNAYPTVEELLTHTSGYKGYYLESPMISNFFTGKNSFYGVTQKMVLDKAGRLSMPEEAYPFNYSNYGYALLGLVLETIYGDDYTALVNGFTEELELGNTGIFDRKGDLGGYWDWQAGDAYLSAGGLTSNVEDMLSYAEMLLDGAGYLGDCQKSRKEINASTKQYSMMGIRMDEIGMAWILDRENGIVWHNGGTGNYNSYLGFCPETGTAVVVLSNLAPNDRIPATVLGVKLLSELRE